ncbi:unnamed protein product [Adineta ricciae]|uniref:NAD(P)(+)--arginine ADP-ribosyltransferase n=1 Tax=Adineta ricciae TaxID=249248 RepID=A0A815R3Q7_ADIRI|nr:unnamed protein product [Adineta ricciae]
MSTTSLDGENRREQSLEKENIPQQTYTIRRTKYMSRFIQEYYNEREPSFYHYYRKQPLLPLEIALESLVLSVGGLHQHVKTAETKRHHFSQYKLTDDESAAIYLYTSEWGEQSLHNLLNQAITSDRYSIIVPWFGFLKLLNTALEKLPSVKGVVFRAIRKDIANKLYENREISWWNFSSCSYSSSFIRQLINENLCLCSIEVLNGKNVRNFTPNTSEDEVLLCPGTQLLLKDVIIDSYTNSCSLLFLKEICPDISETSQSVDKSVPSQRLLPRNDISIHGFSFEMLRSLLLSVDRDNKHEDNGVISTIKFMTGDIYEVTRVNGETGRFGKYTSADGMVYKGYEAENRATGKGVWICSNGDRYEGNFELGRMQKFGILYRAGGYVYEGNWIGGRPYGHGKSMWPNGTCYEGSHEKGKPNGAGRFYSNDGDEYEGDHVDGKAQGWGKRRWKNGDCYDGKFDNDRKHGFGTYIYKNGSTYTGVWFNDRMSGKGMFVWTSGSRYDGAFSNGKMHGYGRLTFADGRRKLGYWKNGKYVGKRSSQ